MTGRMLVVNGDDFGLTPGVNAGIVDAHTRGILTSASLFPNAPATEHAIALVGQTPTLGVGCHLTLVDGSPVLPAARVRSLAPDGAFRPTWRAFLGAALAGRIVLDEVRRELEAQIERLRGMGVAVRHLDSHKHVHAYPPVFAIVARIARRMGVRSVRVPCESLLASWRSRTAWSPGARRQSVENAALAPWAAYDRRLLAREGLPPAPFFLGRVLTGLLTTSSLRGLVDSVPEGISELMTHPGYVDEQLERTRTRLRAERAAEVAALIDPAIRAAVERGGITLQSHDAAHHAESHTHVS